MTRSYAVEILTDTVTYENDEMRQEMLASFLCSYGVVDDDDLAESLVAGLMQRLRADAAAADADADAGTADTANAATNAVVHDDGGNVGGAEGGGEVGEGAAEVGSLAAVPKATRNESKGGKGGKGKAAKKDNSGAKARRAELKQKQQQDQQQRRQQQADEAVAHEEQRHSQEREELGDEAATSGGAQAEAETEVGAEAKEAGAESVSEDATRCQAVSDAGSDHATEGKPQVSFNCFQFNLKPQCRKTAAFLPTSMRSNESKPSYQVLLKTPQQHSVPKPVRGSHVDPRSQYRGLREVG